MKLKQRELCHNCNKEVDFEFDDVTVKQVIICPNCGHEHWRELDEGTIINIRAFMGDRLYIAEPIDHICMMQEDVVASTPIEYKTFKVIGQTADGRPIIEKTEETINGISTEQTKRVSERRWGRDRKQGG